MNRLRSSVVGLVSLTLGLLVAASVRAQAGITVAPTQLAVTGARGTIETRTLLLRTTDPITSLQVIPLDLPRIAGDVILPAEAIRATLPTDQIAANGLLTVPITFDLSRVPSGQFSGELLVSYYSNALAIPVNVTVKDPWLLPAITLAAGVGLGIVISIYRAQGQPRDKVLVRMGQLRAQMQTDMDLAEPFRTRIGAHLVDIEAALQVEKWQDAQTALERAEAAWTRWRRGRADWLTQLAYHTELAQRLKDEADVPYVQAVRRGLEATLRDVPDLEEPNQLQAQLVGLAQQINRYVRLQAWLDELNDLRIRSPADQAEPCRLKAQALQRRLHDLKPDDEAAYQALQSDLEVAIAESSRLVSQQGRQEATVKGTRDLSLTAPRLLAPAPPASSITVKEQVSSAHTRLRLFTLISYAISVVLLAGIGFDELYVANSAFGANAWGDYFALLAWGFGAEATRAAIVQVMHNWGLPGIE